MLAEAIKREVSRVKIKYGTDDLYEICKAMKIQILDMPMGTSDRACKGFFFINARCMVITINSDLPDHIRRIILAHELGHAILHRKAAISAFHEFAMFDDTDRMEYEANVFAAEFLLDDDEVLERLQEQMDFFTMAKVLSVPPELLDFKCRILQRQGYEINAPYIAKGDFLKRNLEQPLN